MLEFSCASATTAAAGRAVGGDPAEFSCANDVLCVCKFKVDPRDTEKNGPGVNAGPLAIKITLEDVTFDCTAT